MMNTPQYTTEEAMHALAMTAEEIEEMEANPNSADNPDDNPPTIGKYGNLFLSFLREQHPSRHAHLLLEMTLHDLCLQVDREAREMMETLDTQLRAKTPRPKNDFLATVQYETTICDQAEEIVLRDIVYRRR